MLEINHEMQVCIVETLKPINYYNVNSPFFKLSLAIL